MIQIVKISIFKIIMSKHIIALLLLTAATFGQLLHSDATPVDAEQNSEETQLPPVVSIKSSFSNSTIDLGDTVVLTIALSYTKANHPLLFQANEGSQFNNLEVKSVNIDQKKEYNTLGYKNITTYTYVLQSQGPGSAGNNSFTFAYDHMGQKFEIGVEAKNIEVLPRRDKTVTLIVAGLSILLLLILAVVVVMKRKKRLLAEQNTTKTDFKNEVDTLKKRIKKTDSSNVLREVEKICITWLNEAVSSIDELTIQELYALYAAENSEHIEGWKHLIKECDHLKFGGGKREYFELMETMHILYACLELKEEDE